MRMYLGKFIRGIEECDSENIICPIEGYDRYKYLNRRLLIRVLLMIPYGYNFGYNLASYKSIEDIKIVFIKLIVFYLISFLIYTSLTKGIDIHLGPPRPLDNSLDWIICVTIPYYCNNLLVT